MMDTANPGCNPSQAMVHGRSSLTLCYVNLTKLLDTCVLSGMMRLCDQSICTKSPAGATGHPQRITVGCLRLSATRCSASCVKIDRWRLCCRDAISRGGMPADPPAAHPAGYASVRRVTDLHRHMLDTTHTTDVHLLHTTVKPACQLTSDR